MILITEIFMLSCRPPVGIGTMQLSFAAIPARLDGLLNAAAISWQQTQRESLC